jgi:hypothetical protein
MSAERRQLCRSCLVAVIMLVHDTGCTNSELWVQLEELTCNRWLVFCHLQQGVQLDDVQQGRDFIQSRLLPERWDCSWGSVGMVQATILAMHAALQQFSLKAHTALLVSGLDVPVAPLCRAEALVNGAHSLLFKAAGTHEQEAELRWALSQVTGVTDAKAISRSLVAHTQWIGLKRSHVQYLYAQQQKLPLVAAVLGAAATRLQQLEQPLSELELQPYRTDAGLLSKQKTAKTAVNNKVKGSKPDSIVVGSWIHESSGGCADIEWRRERAKAGSPAAAFRAADPSKAGVLAPDEMVPFTILGMAGLLTTGDKMRSYVCNHNTAVCMVDGAAHPATFTSLHGTVHRGDEELNLVQVLERVASNTKQLTGSADITLFLRKVDLWDEQERSKFHGLVAEVMAWGAV